MTFAMFAMGPSSNPGLIVRRMESAEHGVASAPNPARFHSYGGTTRRAAPARLRDERKCIEYAWLPAVCRPRYDPISMEDGQCTHDAGQFRSLILTHNDTRFAKAGNRRVACRAEIFRSIVIDIEPSDVLHLAED